jgi:hypothetical protein
MVQSAQFDGGYLNRRRAAFLEANRMLAAMGPIPSLAAMRPIPSLGGGYYRPAFSMPRGWGMGDAGSSTASGGAALLAMAPFTGPAAPFVAAAGAVTEFISSFLHPNLTKEEASAIVNEISADHLTPNLNAWNALPGYQRNSVAKAAALNVFNKWWQVLVQACENAQLGAAGVNCVGDRERGGRLDWWALFYDPIALDPNTAAADQWATDQALAMAPASSGDGSGAGPGSSTPAPAGGQPAGGSGPAASSTNWAAAAGVVVVFFALGYFLVGGDS